MHTCFNFLNIQFIVLWSMCDIYKISFYFISFRSLFLVDIIIGSVWSRE